MHVATLALSLLPTFIQSEALLVHELTGGPSAEAFASAAVLPDAGEVVPFPKGVLLLGVAEGLFPGDAVPSFGFCPPSIPRISEERAPLLIGLLDQGLEQIEELVRRLRDISVHVSSSGQTSEDLARHFRALTIEVQRIARTATFEGIHLLDGSVTRLCVGGAFEVLGLSDMGQAALGIDSATFNVQTFTNATAALASIDTALFSITLARSEVARIEERLGVGPALGGLRETERVLERMHAQATQAADGTLNTGDRIPLDRAMNLDITRLQRIGENVSFQGISLLDGSRDVCLQGPLPLGPTLFVDLPDVTAFGLGFSGASLGTVSSAAFTLDTVNQALEFVVDERTRLADLRRSLADGRLDLRRR